MKIKLGAQRLLFPLPTVLIVTGTMEQANIVTIAWISILSSKPPTLGISVGTKGYSGALIKEHRNFSVNLVQAEIMKEADFCGITSGKEVDKFEKTKLTKQPASIITSPIIKECPLNLECKVVEANMAGSTNHFIAEIVETHIDSDKIGDPARLNSLNLELLDPLIYISGKREYRKLGKKLGDAYQIGKELL